MGVVVLSNSETPAIADQIGFHLLDQQAQRRGADEKTETEKESEQR
jgi:hypothetical protein